MSQNSISVTISQFPNISYIDGEHCKSPHYICQNILIYLKYVKPVFIIPKR